MKLKSDVSLFFPIFKNLVEKQFTTKIKTCYSDNDGEFIKLRSFFEQHSLSHLTNPPRTPEHNGLSELKHPTPNWNCPLSPQSCFSLPPNFWPYAFQTAAYLINRLPTTSLDMTTPYHVLFDKPPNYTKFKTFGCLCFPRLKPYTNSKLEI